MQAIIPAAGQGTRLYPQTHTKPKAMVRLAGRPILGHILDSLSETGIDEVIIIVGGPMQEQIAEYATEEYQNRFDFAFPEQPEAKGLGHSVYQAREHVNESVFIALGDMLFENGYRQFIDAHRSFGAIDGSIGVKAVDSPQHYGVAELDGGRIAGLVEKPEDPPSDWALSGVYIIEDTPALFDALESLIENRVLGTGGEYQLTDALQHMVDKGANLHTFEVENWYDCGRPETILEANRVLLSKSETNSTSTLDNVVVVPPVDFGNDIVVEDSVVGPYVSVDDGARITESIIRNGIVGRNATLSGVNLEESIVGDGATVRGEPNHLNVGDNSTVHL